MTSASDYSQPWLDFLQTAQSAWTPGRNPWAAAFGAPPSGAASSGPGMQALFDMLQATVQATTQAAGAKVQTPQQVFDEMSKTMTPLLQQLLQGQQPWQTLWASAAPNMSADGVFEWLQSQPLGRGLAGNDAAAPLGAAREYLRQGQAHSAKLAQLPAKLAAFAEVLRGFPDGLQQALRKRLTQLGDAQQSLDSVRAVLDLWIDAAEEAFAQIAHSKAYAQTQGELTDLLMELKIERQTMLDQSLEVIGLPSRRELDTTHRRVATLRRENRRYQSELAALRADVDNLKQSAARSRRPATKKPATGAKA